MGERRSDLLGAVGDELDVLLGLELADGELPGLQQCRQLLSRLELPISLLLQREFDAWEWERLDGILPARVTRTSPASLDIVGLAILVSDQNTTPIHVELEAGAGAVTLFGQIGAPGPGDLGLARVPYRGDGMFKEMERAARRNQHDRWVFEVRVRDALPERLKVEETFMISGRGLAVVLDGQTELGVGVPHDAEILTPSGRSHRTKAYKDWLLRRQPSPTEKEAFLLLDLDKDDVPVGSVVRFGERPT